MRIVVLFNLKSGVDTAVYEEWALARDIPGVRSLPSIDDFRVYRTTGLLGGGGAAPYAYVEILDVIDMQGFATDAGSAAMQAVVREFEDYADAPVFMLTEQID